MRQAEDYHILVVDDDERLRHLLVKYLSDSGWTVTAASDVPDARDKMGFFLFDLILLDVMMPGESGVEFAQALRKDNAVPILMLTAMGEVEDRISGLEAGADDYLAKPFEPRELVLRVEKLLHRSSGSGPAAEVMIGAYRYDVPSGQLYDGAELVALTDVEQALLRCLIDQQGQVVSRDTLAACLPGSDEQSRRVDVAVTRLRKKLEAEPARPRYVQTVRGQGYILKL